MEAVLYGGFLLLIGVFIYLSKLRGYIVHYFLFWVCFSPLIYHLIFGFTDDALYFVIIQWARYLGIVLFILQFTRNKTSKGGLIFVLLVIAFLYSVFLSVYRGTSITSTIKFVFGTYFDLIILLGIIDVPARSRSLFKFIKGIIYIQVICAVFQMLTGSTFYPKPPENNMVTGTFYGANLMAEFISVLLYVVLYLESYTKGRISSQNWFLLLAVTIVVFFTGIRMALVSHVLISAILLYLIFGVRINKKVLILGGAFGVIVLYFVFSGYLSTADVTYDSNVTSAAERQNVLASVFLDEDYLSEHTTMYYTVFVLSFFYLNPIFGPGLLYQNATGYGGVINMESQSLTDCTLALKICESGLIGVLLFILIYYYVLHKLCDKSKGAKLVFYYMLIVSITDPGIFFIGNYLGFIALILIEKQNELFKARS